MEERRNVLGPGRVRGLKFRDRVMGTWGVGGGGGLSKGKT